MKTKAVQKILVAVDFSSCSRAALELARSLGDSLGASIDVLFVRQPGSGDEMEHALAAKDELHQFIAGAGRNDPPAGERVETGDARERIVTIAEKDAYDLIVLGTHGRTGRSRMLAGSVAESVVRTATRPVLTVRE